MKRIWSFAVCLMTLAATALPGVSRASTEATLQAPYDTGWVCYKLIYPIHQATCAENVDAMRAGILIVGGTRVLPMPVPAPPDSDPVWTPHVFRAASASRISVQGPGTLIATARVEGLQIDDNAQVCLGFAGTTSCTMGEELLRLAVPDEIPGSVSRSLDIQHSARVLGSGPILIHVSVEKQYTGLAKVLVERIDVLFTPDQ